MLNCVGGWGEQVWVRVLLARWRDRTSAPRKHVWEGRQECCSVGEEMGSSGISRWLLVAQEMASDCCRLLPAWVCQQSMIPDFFPCRVEVFCTCKCLTQGLSEMHACSKVSVLPWALALVLVLSVQMRLNSSVLGRYPKPSSAQGKRFGSKNLPACSGERWVWHSSPICPPIAFRGALFDLPQEQTLGVPSLASHVPLLPKLTSQ